MTFFFAFQQSKILGLEMEGGIGTPLAGRIVVAAVFDGGVAVEQGRWRNILAVQLRQFFGGWGGGGAVL